MPDNFWLCLIEYTLAKHAILLRVYESTALGFLDLLEAGAERVVGDTSWSWRSWARRLHTCHNRWYRIHCLPECLFARVVVVASHGGRGVANYGLHSGERNPCIRGDGNERVSERMECRRRRSPGAPFKHHTRLNAGLVEYAAQPTADVPAVRGEGMRDGAQDESAARFKRHLGEETGEFWMKRDCHGPPREIATRLLRDNLDDGRGEIHGIPREATAVSKAHTGVDGDGEKHAPFASVGFRSDEKTANLVQRKLAPRVAIAGVWADAAPRVGERGGTAFKHEAEHLAQSADAKVAGDGGVSRPEVGNILLDHRASNFAWPKHIGMELAHPDGEVSPSPAFRLERCRGEPRCGRRGFIVCPRFEECCEHIHTYTSFHSQATLPGDE